MDIRCPRCGEPWDIDSLHEEVEYRYPNQPWYIEDRPEGFTFQHKENDNLWYSSAIYASCFEPVRKEFLQNGCITLTLYNTKACEVSDRSSLLRAIYEIEGDDLDAAASDIDDAERMGLL